jgi:cation diffusion facilitator CzcD-associated flavoprotein CzcO
MNQPKSGETTENDKNLETTVAIIGSGFSGLGMAIQLRKRRRDDFLILEKSHDIGGTWRDNTYPGCGCDVPTAIYSYSFEQNPYWSKMWSSQPEIQAYLQRLTDKYDLRRKAVFGTEIIAMEWDEAASRWHLRSADGRTITAHFIVLGVGPLNVPRIPHVKGLEAFAGSLFHSAQWDHSVDLAGKTVAVIGTGASATQFVPAIAGQVRQLQLYQRTPPWVLGRGNPSIPRAVQTLMAKVPLTRNICRAAAFWISESMAIGLHGYCNLHRPLERAGRANIHKSVKDPALVAKLTPTYQIGCKRVLFSRTYYPALARANAEVITDGIAEVRPWSIVTVDGIERAVDVIICATGFHVFDRFDSFDIRGVRGEPIVQRWKTDGAQAHMGVTVAGLPNAFFLMGANTGITHNSIVFMIEQQIKVALHAMDGVQQRGAAASIQVRQEAQDRFNEDIQRRLTKRVWSTAGCTNWFVDDKGVNRVLWPGFTWQYWRATRKFDETEYEFAHVDRPRTVARKGNITTGGEQGAPGAHRFPRSTSLPQQRVGSA